MSSSTPVTLLPTPGSAPSVLQLPAGQVFPNADGTFTVQSALIGPLLAGGWQIVVAADTTHVP
jgi:hypothetical protein